MSEIRGLTLPNSRIYIEFDIPQEDEDQKIIVLTTFDSMNSIAVEIVLNKENLSTIIKQLQEAQESLGKS